MVPLDAKIGEMKTNYCLRACACCAIIIGLVAANAGLLLRYHQETDPPPSRANRPIEIDANLSAVEQVLGASRP